ncbi:hypothetical protein CRYUN_Cryun11dG0057500 [Craigia yunnanensis]
MKDLEILLGGSEGSDGRSTRFMVIGKIISGKILYRKRELNILRNIWSIEIAPMIRELGANMYSIYFANEILMASAMEEGPWSLMRHCMVLKEREEGAVATEV